MPGAAHEAVTDAANGPRSVGRVVQLLDCLAASRQGVSLSSLAQAMAAPKTTLLGLLRGLAAAGFAVQVEGAWRLGPEAFGLARAILAGQGQGFGSAGRQVLESLAEGTGETAMLAALTPDRTAMVYTDKVESRTALRFAATVGDHRPIHCTASGRVMLAFLPPPWPEEFLRSARLAPVTRTSVTDRRTLRRIVTEVREQGYAVTLGESTEGVVGIAAPVFDARGEVVASVVLAGPIARVEPKLASLARRVGEAGRGLSRQLGYRPMRGDSAGE